jgi:hypothetical protein
VQDLKALKTAMSHPPPMARESLVNAGKIDRSALPLDEEFQEF